jgi:hypothetical protein
VLRFLGSGSDVLVPTELLNVSMISPRRFQPRLFFNRAMVPIISCFEFAFSLKLVLKVATVQTPLAFPYLIGAIAQFFDLYLPPFLSPGRLLSFVALKGYRRTVYRALRVARSCYSK